MMDITYTFSLKKLYNSIIGHESISNHKIRVKVDNIEKVTKFRLMLPYIMIRMLNMINQTIFEIKKRKLDNPFVDMSVY